MVQVKTLEDGGTKRLFDLINMDLSLHSEEAFYWKRSGKRAGYLSEDGYRYIRLDGVLYGEHRLVYLLQYKVLPELVDHRDRNPSNNNINNLRAANKRINAINTGLPNNNRSGVKGVSWHKAGKKWTAQINNKGVKYHLGSYNNLLDAVEARLKAEEEFWYDVE